jgi:hypothetical protein
MKISKKILSYFTPTVMRVGECGVLCVNFIIPTSPTETPPRRSLDPPAQAKLRLSSVCFQIPGYTYLWLRVSAYAHPPVSPPPGLPRCGGHHRTHILPTRWSIWANCLHRTATRVRTRPDSFAFCRSPFRIGGEAYVCVCVESDQNQNKKITGPTFRLI